jgi:group I intron endonuclease
MTSGIYIIKNIENGYCYIGSSVDIDVRLSAHFYSLLKGNHSNSQLQNDFNTYDICSFVSEPIYFCSIEKLEEKEQYYIDKYDKTYNKRTSAIGISSRRRNKKNQLSIKLPNYLIDELTEIANTENRSVPNLIETIIIEKITD